MKKYRIPTYFANFVLNAIHGFCPWDKVFVIGCKCKTIQIFKDCKGLQLNDCFLKPSCICVDHRKVFCEYAHFIAKKLEYKINCAGGDAVITLNSLKKSFKNHKKCNKNYKNKDCDWEKYYKKLLSSKECSIKCCNHNKKHHKKDHNHINHQHHNTSHHHHTNHHGYDHHSYHDYYDHDNNYFWIVILLIIDGLIIFYHFFYKNNNRMNNLKNLFNCNNI